MRPYDYDQVHRRYYLDHQSSLEHRQPYVIPLENQYSALSNSRNPYHVLDHLNLQVNKKYHKEILPTDLTQQSLNGEMREWTRRQDSKDRNYQNVRKQLRDLSNLVKRKEEQNSNLQMNRSINLMPNQSALFPMMMPSIAMGGMPGMSGMPGCYHQMQCCHHQCAPMGCRNQCNCRCACDSGHRGQPVPRPSKMAASVVSRPRVTQNKMMEPQKESKVEQASKASLRSIKSEPRVVVAKEMKLKKKSGKNLLRRFRICAWAVYFCVYFKWFSFQFSLNRYNRFKMKYLVDSGKDITSAFKEVYDKLLAIDMPTLARKAADNLPDKSTGQELDLASLLKEQNSRIYDKLSGKISILTNDKQTLMLRCAEFISLLLEEVEAVMGEWDWGASGEALGVGALNQTYMIDSFFLPHEILLLNLHESKGYARIIYKNERVLVMIKIIVKMLLFNVLLQLDNNSDWSKQHQKQLEDKGDASQFFIFLEICSKMMFVICQQLYMAAVEGGESNYYEVSERFKIEPSNPLVYHYSISRRRQLLKSQEVKDSNLLIYGIDKLDEVNNLMEGAFFKQGRKRVANSVNALIDQLVSKLKETNLSLYQEVWEQTLSNEYLILRGTKKYLKSARLYPTISNSVISDGQNRKGERKDSKFTSYKSKLTLQDQTGSYSQNNQPQKTSITNLSIARRLPRR